MKPIANLATGKLEYVHPVPRDVPGPADAYDQYQTYTDGARTIQLPPRSVSCDPLPLMPAYPAESPYSAAVSGLIRSGHATRAAAGKRGGQGAAFHSSAGPARPRQLTKKQFHRLAKSKPTAAAMAAGRGGPVGTIDRPSQAALVQGVRLDGGTLPEFSYAARREVEPLLSAEEDGLPAWQRVGGHPPLAEANPAVQRRWQRLVRREQSTLLTIARLALPAGALFDLQTERSVVLKRGVGRLERLMSCPLKAAVAAIWAGERRPQALSIGLPAASAVVIRLVLQLLHELAPAQSSFAVQFGQPSPNVSWDYAPRAASGAPTRSIQALYTRDLPRPVPQPSAWHSTDTTVGAGARVENPDGAAPPAEAAEAGSPAIPASTMHISTIGASSLIPRSRPHAFSAETTLACT